MIIDLRIEIIDMRIKIIAFTIEIIKCLHIVIAIIVIA